MELVLDAFCGHRFGPNKQLEVLAVIDKVGYTKTYSVKCYECANDPELFGEAIFKSYRSNILRNYLPCGCGARPLWNQQQFKIICEREADKRNFKFLGFSGDYRGNKTRLELECELHGIWNTTDINHFLNGRGCQGCKASACAEAARGNTYSRMDDLEMIKSFMDTGSFHPNTIFTRCDPSKTGRKASDWQVDCPVCGITVFARSCNIKLGYRPCSCGSGKQTLAYINTISNNSIILGIKYGIAVNPTDRMKKQDWKSLYTIRNFGVWKFLDPQSCRDA